MGMRGKKASLSLSVNAIVVLILAIVLLAFGLSFITKLLGRGEQSLEGLFPSPEIQPTPTKPMGIPDSLLIKPGSTVRMTVNILNTGVAIGGAPVLLTTADAAASGCPVATDLKSSGAVNIGTGAVATLKLIITGRPGLVDNSICSMTFNSITQNYFLTTKGSI